MANNVVPLEIMQWANEDWVSGFLKSRRLADLHRYRRQQLCLKFACKGRPLP